MYMYIKISFHKPSRLYSVAFYSVFRHPQYLSPEVLCEYPVQYDEHSESEPSVLTPTGPKSDVWSLGLILLEVLTVSIHILSIFTYMYINTCTCSSWCSWLPRQYRRWELLVTLKVYIKQINDIYREKNFGVIWQCHKHFSKFWALSTQVCKVHVFLKMWYSMILLWDIEISLEYFSRYTSPRCN